MQAVDDALDQYQRDKFLNEMNARYARLKAVGIPVKLNTCSEWKPNGIPG